jgi:DNA-binding PadR family transcriptional regulator
MALLILGLLMLRNLTVYDIKTILERKISPFYAASLGSIQAAIKKLLDQSLIDYSEKVVNGRNKKEYFINPSGQEAFYGWMREDIKVNKFNNEAILKVFFLGFLTKPERMKLIHNHIIGLGNEYAEMIEFKTETSLPDLLQHQREIYEFQMAALDYAIQEIKLEIDWFTQLLKNIEEEKLHEYTQI